MKLLQIVFSGLGGHASVGFSLIDADTEKEYTHVIIFYGIEEVSAGYKAKCSEMGVDYFFVKKNAGLDIPSQKQIICLLKKIAPDIILLHSVSIILPVSFFCLFSKTRLISVEHQSNELKTSKDWIFSFLLVILSEKTVYLTELYREQVKKRLGFIFRPKRSKVINNGINTDIFNPSPKVEITTVKIIGMLSRFTENKDHLVLLDAFKLLMNKNNGGFQVKLLLAGDGITKPKLEHKVAQLELHEHVKFAGLLSEEESATFLKSLDIYVHASFGETMSTAIMQAMACGLPVIASDVPGINNMIQHNITGILVPVKDPVALANAINQLINDPAMAGQLANNAFNFAAGNYSNKRMLENYKSIFTN